MIKKRFFLFLIAFSFHFYASALPHHRNKNSCASYLENIDFTNKSYAVLSKQSPLTEREALSLFNNIHLFAKKKMGVSANKLQFALFLKNSTKPRYKDEVYVPQEPELMALPEMQKLISWYKEINEASLAEMENDLGNKKNVAYLSEIILNTGTTEHNPHVDSVYARVVMTALGPSTEVIDKGQIFTAERGESLLISGNERTYHHGVLATTHQSPYNVDVSQRLLIQMSYKHPTVESIHGLETGLAPLQPERINPTLVKDGFQFFKEVIQISEDEIDSLNQELKAALDKLGLKQTDFKLDLGTSLNRNNAEVGENSIYNKQILQYLAETKNPTFKKIKDQVAQFITHPEKYFFEGGKCKYVQAVLRIGFESVPLYSDGAKLNSSPIMLFHKDGIYGRILIPLLGEPTEIFSVKDGQRVYAPMRQATSITGTSASEKLATLHRAPNMKAEDRWLIAITCFPYFLK